MKKGILITIYTSILLVFLLSFAHFFQMVVPHKITNCSGANLNHTLCALLLENQLSKNLSVKDLPVEFFLGVLFIVAPISIYGMYISKIRSRGQCAMAEYIVVLFSQGILHSKAP